jgi:hypothetical protein
MVLPANLATNDVIDETWVDAVTTTLADLTAAITPTAWTAVTFAGSWVNLGGGYQTAQYRKVGDMVQVRGIIKSGVTATAAFTLPAGFRPPVSTEFAQGPTAGAYLSVQTNGVVTIYSSNTAEVTVHFSFSTVA